MSSDENSFKFSENSLNIFKEKIKSHHELYKKIRCKAEYLEEIIVQSLRSTKEKVKWNPAGHEQEKDILVNDTYKIQIKSGTLTQSKLKVSGHRLGRFENNFNKITDFLNKLDSDIYATTNPSPRMSTNEHKYHLYYVNKKAITGIKKEDWEKSGAGYKNKNTIGTIFLLKPTMSWQIWWEIPLSYAEKVYEINI